MSDTFYIVDQIANMLNIHPKTIQRYIREGKLRATKIGKGWRISGHDLSTFIENSHDERISSDIRPDRSTVASAVIDVPVDRKDDAVHIMNIITAAMNSKPFEYGRSSMQSQYIENENMIRITLWGNIRFTSIMLDTITALTEQNNEE